MSVDDMGEDVVCSSVVPFSSTSVGPIRPVLEDMTLIPECACCQASNKNAKNTNQQRRKQSLSSKIDGVAAEQLEFENV
jgi:hypothetical protein